MEHLIKRWMKRGGRRKKLLEGGPTSLVPTGHARVYAGRVPRPRPLIRCPLEYGNFRKRLERQSCGFVYHKQLDKKVEDG